MSPAARAALIGTVSALVVVALAAAGGVWYLRRSGVLSKLDSPARVVVVFSGPAEDGAQVAQLVLETGADGSVVRTVPPETSATVPGTTYGTLRDAYPFGGAAAVARAVGGGSAEVGWIDVPASAWSSAVERAGGVKVSLPRTVDVFDGTTLSTFPQGESTVSGAGVLPLVNGIAYLPAASRATVLDGLARASVRALAGAGTSLPPGCATNLADAAYAKWAAGAR